MSAENSNRLPVLAAEIRRAHADAQDAARTAAQRAIECGNALIEAKGLVKHGQWLPWLTDAGMNDRTARAYMQLARSGLKSATVADLGIRGALECVACGGNAEKRAAMAEGKRLADKVRDFSQIWDALGDPPPHIRRRVRDGEAFRAAAFGDMMRIIWGDEDIEGLDAVNQSLSQV